MPAKLSHLERVGGIRTLWRRDSNLELCWNLQTGRWPFDPGFLAAEVLPVLSRELERFAHLYTELPPRPSGTIAAGELLPRLAAQSGRRLQILLDS